jgi:ABC-2 type transport system ATP-binding protein
VSADPSSCARGRNGTMDAMTDDSAITVRGLRKAYGGTAAVDGLDLDVRRGEVFALLGPNGAGKTTTVEILEGYRKRDDGAVRVLDRDPQHADADWRARIGIVLQNTGEFEELTVREVVTHFAHYYPAPDDPAKVIERVGLGEKINAKAKTLSGGQQRRLDVALGIVGRPELLFLDEPTTGFDPVARREFWELVRDLAAAGTTILLTTHYLDEAEALANRVGVITRGKLLEVAPPSTLGGRNTAQATVHWLDAGGPRLEVTDTPTEFVVALSGQYTGEIPELRVSRPTLEDIYLKMIGEDVR